MNKINVSGFIDNLNKSLIPSVHILQGEVLKSSLFLHSIRNWIIKKGVQLRVIDLEAAHFFDVIRQVETSILGTTALFWLVARSEQKQKIVQEYIRYFLSYKGPHSIIFFDPLSLDIGPSTEQSAVQIVEIPTLFDKELLKKCIDSGIIGHSLLLQADVADMFNQKIVHASLDDITLLAQYVSLCGKQKKQFIAHWLDRIIPSEQSLFLISQYLLAKKGKDFFRLWDRISGSYSPQFWITFWSEQFWRSAFYTQLMQQKNHSEAKKIVFRLPYTFVKRDWQQHSVTQLRDAHQKIYAIDCFIKRGGDPVGSLELFFSQFLQSESESNLSY